MFPVFTSLAFHTISQTQLFACFIYKNLLSSYIYTKRSMNFALCQIEIDEFTVDLDLTTF